MDLVKLREELEIDEGVEYKIYNDHLGYPTFGVGHLILESDPEHGEEVGTPVSEERVIEAFEKDVEIVVDDCKVLYPDFDDLPEEAQRVIANMMFNMEPSKIIQIQGYEKRSRLQRLERESQTRWLTATGIVK